MQARYAGKHPGGGHKARACSLIWITYLDNILITGTTLMEGGTPIQWSAAMLKLQLESLRENGA